MTAEKQLISANLNISADADAELKGRTGLF
jgi:hypothetical protein